MSAGMPMYFLWRLNVIRVPGWRSPRMGKISCYIIGSISASVDRGIMFWAVDMHICVVILDPSRCGDHREPTGRAVTGGWMIRDVLTVSTVGTQIKVESKDKSWFKGRNGALGAECEWRCDKEKYGSWHEARLWHMGEHVRIINVGGYVYHVHDNNSPSPLLPHLVDCNPHWH